jgi:hypothetical protein
MHAVCRKIHATRQNRAIGRQLVQYRFYGSCELPGCRRGLARRDTS